MSNSARVAVIGTSYYADVMHLAALQSHPDADIAAICGRNQQRAQRLAEKYHIPVMYTDYQDVFSDNSLDAVIIAVPDDLHYPLTLAAVDAGLHVICEKPLAQNLEQARRMCDRAARSDVITMTYFTWRWLPHCEYIKRLIDSGYIGHCFHAELGYLSDYGLSRAYAWRWDATRALGVLGDLGSHIIHLLQWYLGDITSVSAQIKTCVEKTGMDGNTMPTANDFARLNLQCQQGTEVAITVSAVADIGDHGQQQRLEFYGDAGILQARFDLKNGYHLYGKRHTDAAIKELPVPEDILQGIPQDMLFTAQRRRVFTEKNVGTRLFIDAVSRGKPVQPDLHSGYQVQRVIDAAVRAHAEGEPMYL